MNPINITKRLGIGLLKLSVNGKSTNLKLWPSVFVRNTIVDIFKIMTFLILLMFFPTLVPLSNMPHFTKAFKAVTKDFINGKWSKIITKNSFWVTRL